MTKNNNAWHRIAPGHYTSGNRSIIGKKGAWWLFENGHLRGRWRR